MPSQKLSCDGCRAHKVRCSRQEPQCDRCRVFNTDCHYSQRRPRASKPKDLGLDPRHAGVINGILERLDRLELASRSNTGSPSQSVGPSSHRYQSSHNSSTISDSQSDADMLDDEHVETSPSSTDLSKERVDEILEPKLYGMISKATDSALFTFRNSHSLSEGDISTQAALVELKNALSNVHDTNLLRSTIDEIEDDFQFPAELTTEWIEYGLQYMQTEFFLGLVDWDLISTIPKIIHSPHLRLDHSMLLVYNIVLYFGWLVSGNSTQDEDFPKKMYARCLTLWKHKSESENRTLQLVAAVWMTWMSIENLDYTSAWKFHCEACRLARVLELDQIDNPANLRNDDDQTEMKRKGFWQLVHTDYAFRLSFGRPAMIISTKFQVNFPSLKVGTSVAATGDTVEGTIGDTTFVVTSRIAFIVTEFFGNVENCPKHSSNELNWKIESLCDQIESLFVEWKIEEVLENTSQESVVKWMLADLLMQGYTSIILMQQQWYGDFAQDLTIKRSLRVSRKLLKASILLVETGAKVGSISFNFAGGYSFIALFTLYTCLLDYYDCTHEVHSNKSCLEDLVMMNKLCSSLKNATTVNQGDTGPKAAADNLLTVLQRIISKDQIQFEGFAGR